MATTAEYTGSSNPSSSQISGSVIDDDMPEYDRTEEEYADEMQRELGDDAPWKRIQQNTFTRWANEHLKLINKSINDLQHDLSDGLALIGLIEVLSQRKLPRHNRRPAFRSQKLENVSVALDFLENVERIKLVNIDASHIVDGRLKLILGLIWTLILHYSIQLSTWECVPVDNEVPGRDPTPKQKLMNWVKNMLPPDLPINNFTTDWNDGRAIGALVNACAPGLYPDWEKQDPRKPLQNAKGAMDLAEEWLNVPQLIRPEEMIDPNVDDRSMMTYLSQFPNAKLKPGAPVKGRQSLAEAPRRSSVPRGPVRCYGKGIEPTGNFVDEQTQFFVDTSKTGIQAAVQVKVINPHGREEPVRCQARSPDVFEFLYTPSMEGPYRIIVKHGNEEVPGSPFTTAVKGPSKPEEKEPPRVKRASGPGIGPTPIPVNNPTWFEVDVNSGRLSPNEAAVYDPRGNLVPLKAVQLSPQKIRYEYTPLITGVFRVDITELVPYKLNVIADPFLAKQCRAYGRGIQPVGIRTGDVADFVVVTPESRPASSEPLKVSIKGPDTFEVPCRAQRSSPQSYECAYVPQKPGPHEVSIQYDGSQIPQSPFDVMVAPFVDSKIRAYGPGLEGGVVGFPADFVVETNDETGTLGFSIEGPSETKIECSDNGDGSAKVRYWPTAPGEYAVHIASNEEDIPNSPYMAWIDPQSDESFNPGKVRTYGPGIDSQQTQTVGRPSEFTVDAHLAGPGNLKVSCIDTDYRPIDVNVRDNKNGTYACKYVPLTATPHTITIGYGQVAVPGSPFRVNVSEASDPRRVKVFGPGIEDDAQVNKDTYFVVDCKDAGNGDVAVALSDPKGKDVPLDIDANHGNLGPGQYFVGYKPKIAGPHAVNVVYGGEEIPQSPINVDVKPDLSRISVETPEGLSPNEPKKVLIRGLQNSGIDPSAISARVSQPNGSEHDALVDSYGPDVAEVSFKAAGPGPYIVQPSANNAPICSPVVVKAEPKRPVIEYKHPRAYGPGLQEATVNHPAQFTVDTRGCAPDGHLKVTVEGPAEAPIEYVDNQDGTCLVTYTPPLPSTPQSPYFINIFYENADIPGSPFSPQVKPVPGLATAFGPGIDERKGLGPNEPTRFFVDTSKCNLPNTGLRANIVGLTESGQELVSIPSDILSRGFVHEITYSTPSSSCSHVQIDVRLIDDRTCSVLGNPFTVPIRPPPLPTTPLSARAYGEGLYQATTNKPSRFTVETSGDGEGGLNMLIEGPSEAGLVCVENVDNRCLMEYIPTKPGNYTLSIRCVGEHIPGSPFSIDCVSDRPTTNLDNSSSARKIQISSVLEPTTQFKVDTHPTSTARHDAYAYGSGLSHGANGEPCTFTIVTKDAGSGGLAVAVEGPSKAEINCKDNKDGTCDVTWWPTTPGDYIITVKFADQHIAGSPYTAKIRPSKSTGQNDYVSTRNIRVGEIARIPVSCGARLNTTEFNIEQLSARVTSPSGNIEPCNLTRNPNDENTVTITFSPRELGEHLVSVLRNNNQHIPGSPFTVMVGSSDIPRVSGIRYEHTENIVRTRGDLNGGGAHMVRATGPGLTGGQPNQNCEFSLYTKEAGSGSINISIEGPSKAEVFFKNRLDGTCDVSYVCSESGEYKVSVKFNDQDIPNSPFNVLIGGDGSSRRDKITVENFDSWRDYQINRPLTFSANLHGTIGQVDAYVVRPDGTEDVCLVQKSSHDSSEYSMRFVPRQNGLHKIHVRLNGREVADSPFMVNVGGADSELGDATKVFASGAGLHCGQSGIPCEFLVNTKNAGSGAFAVTVDGPSKVQLGCSEVPDGYRVTFLPTAPGDYIITIKLSNQSIAGSPFKCRVTGPGGVDASNTGRSDSCQHREHSNIVFESFDEQCARSTAQKDVRSKHVSGVPDVAGARFVKSFGAALRTARTHQTSTFTVDAAGAASVSSGGESMLMVGMHGVDSTVPCDEVLIKHMGNNVYNVSYTVRSSGHYILVVKWGDCHIPGSPFHVEVP